MRRPPPSPISMDFGQRSFGYADALVTQHMALARPLKIEDWKVAPEEAARKCLLQLAGQITVAGHHAGGNSARRSGAQRLTVTIVKDSECFGRVAGAPAPRPEDRRGAPSLHHRHVVCQEGAIAYENVFAPWELRCIHVSQGVGRFLCGPRVSTLCGP